VLGCAAAWGISRIMELVSYAESAVTVGRGEEAGKGKVVRSDMWPLFGSHQKRGGSCECGRRVTLAIGSTGVVSPRVVFTFSFLLDTHTLSCLGNLSSHFHLSALALAVLSYSTSVHSSPPLLTATLHSRHSRLPHSIHSVAFNPLSSPTATLTPV
jgi:hypothetical protein